MSLALATFAPGAVISAATLRGLVSSVETYINEGTLAADRGTLWMDANHVYRPDFFGAPDPHTTLVSGESYFRNRPIGDDARAYFAYQMGSVDIPVPGMGVSFTLPETLANATRQYRCFIRCSFAAYEYGGGDGVMDNYTNESAKFRLMINGSAVPQVVRRIFKGSRTNNQQETAFFPRQQHSIVSVQMGTTQTGATNPISVGLNNICLSCAPAVESLDADSKPNSKIIFVQQGNLTVRYWLR